MTIVGLMVQLHNGNVIFQQVREYLSHEKAYLVSRAFINQISSYDNAFISRGSTSHLTGSIVVMNMYRVYYMILSEVFILAISHANDNPYEGSLYLARTKRLLTTYAKEINEAQMTRKYNEIYFGMERVLFGEDASELHTSKLTEMQPHYMESNGWTTNGNGLNHSGQMVNSPPSSSSSSPLSSSSSSVNLGVAVGGKILDSPSTALSGSKQGGAPLAASKSEQQRQFDSISKFEDIKLNGSGAAATLPLPKTADKHIYDPPASTKWNAKTSVRDTMSTRVSNRIMFTLRHPNASIISNTSPTLSSSPPNNNEESYRSSDDPDPFYSQPSSNSNHKDISSNIEQQQHSKTNGTTSPTIPDLTNNDKQQQQQNHNNFAGYDPTSITPERSPSVSIPIQKSKINYLSF
ncbi:hypothetical protein SAMD00019534_120130 [Acytostelium subglobosum LB1]|uniref:hypothetical protein n=1 Tax=Acytostelium subglobosum LB1 TaxID=1410327 RepID=UPI0006447F17|nr:hypothetical protein SAMD00019534_120130 [Acytostelium subglobosum LB1]GAM28837.1 hypothetical protein SAMD00019534_120130 [Acytostelium subglobosum LB1]|eukprot:XP_012748209.1 hypothetical protein SAMD00019534_120130 [Acytostelium subglobosum LB1]